MNTTGTATRFSVTTRADGRGTHQPCRARGGGALVAEFDVPPLRRDWRTVLRRGEERFKAWRTWA